MNITTNCLISEWLPDIGAIDHVTSDLSNLQIHSDYYRPDRVRVGYGSGLTISDVGRSLIKIPHQNLVLKRILHVPSITKNIA